MPKAFLVRKRSSVSPLRPEEDAQARKASKETEEDTQESSVKTRKDEDAQENIRKFRKEETLQQTKGNSEAAEPGTESSPGAPRFSDSCKNDDGNDLCSAAATFPLQTTNTNVSSSHQSSAKPCTSASEEVQNVQVSASQKSSPQQRVPPTKEIAVSSAGLSISSATNTERMARSTSSRPLNSAVSCSRKSSKHIAVGPPSFPAVLGPAFPCLRPGYAGRLHEERFPFLPTSMTLPSRDVFFPVHPHISPHTFNFPPRIVRNIPSSELPWPLQPIPLRFPLGLRPEYGLCGVVPSEEIPSPPYSAPTDVSISPVGDMRTSSLEKIRGLAKNYLGVDVNNNCNSELDCDNHDTMTSDLKNQSFKVFLQTAKVRVETINDGKGLKNPLLSLDKSRYPLHNGQLTFMTLDAFPPCPVCGIKCDTPRLLQRHVRTHKEVKRYLCAWCGKGFNDTFDLKRHTRTHTGVRPYKCDSCGKAFTQRCSLESHCRKIHGRILPFTFNERRSKLYVCEECGHSTSNIENHFRHLRTLHPGHPALGRLHHDRRQYKIGTKEGGEDINTEHSSSESLESVSYASCVEDQAGLLGDSFQTSMTASDTGSQLSN